MRSEQRVELPSSGGKRGRAHTGSGLVMGRLLPALLILAALVIGPSARPANAQDAPKWAYVYAYDYTVDSYTPEDGYQFNSSGKPNTIERTDVGSYTVTVPGLKIESQTQLTTISENGERCKLASSTNMKGKVATEHVVNCTAIGGEPVDIGFFLLQFSGSLVTPSAYLWANEPSSDSYTPDERYQFNSAGETNTITRTDTGTYTIELPGQGAESGNIQVTTMNSDPGISCAVRRWEIDDSNLKKVEVNCFDSTGTRVDAGFGLLYVDGSDAAAEVLTGVSTSGAFLIADHNSVKDRYTPGKNYQYSSAGVSGDSERRDMGTYTVYLPEVGAETGILQVTASGKGKSVACSIPRWVLNGTTYEVDVVCFDGEGNLTDSFFNLTYVIATSA